MDYKEFIDVMQALGLARDQGERDCWEKFLKADFRRRFELYPEEVNALGVAGLKVTRTPQDLNWDFAVAAVDLGLMLFDRIARIPRTVKKELFDGLSWASTTALADKNGFSTVFGEVKRLLI